MTFNTWEKLQSKAYHDAFVASQISIGLPFQIYALRIQREWTQQQLAEKTGMLQPRISAMERPGGSKLNLDTLRRSASAFDVALVVRFVPFSELVE
jgi:DNA-binding Xre family transcriptional regulator